MKSIIRSAWFWVSLVTLLGAVLRLYHLGYKSLWLDEAVIYLNSLGGVQEILEKNAIHNSAPPAFTFLIHGMIWIGKEEFWLRLPSCLAGILCIPIAYGVFRRYAGRWSSISGCLLLAVAPAQIRYSQEVREYSLVVLLTLVMVFWIIQYLHSRRDRHLVLFSLTAAIAVLFQYGLSLVTAVLCGMLILNLRKDGKKGIARFTLSLVPILLAVVWVILFSLRHQYQAGGFASTSYLSDAYFSGDMGQLIPFVINNTESILRFAFNAEYKLLLLFLVLLGVISSCTQKQGVPLQLTTGLFAITLLAGLLSLYPYTGQRQTIFLTVPLYLMASIGLSYFETRRLLPALCLLVGLFVFYGLRDSVAYLQAESSQNIKPVQKILNHRYWPDDRIYVSPGSIPAFIYYFSPLSGRSVFSLDYYNRPAKMDPVELAESLAAQPGRVWLLFFHYKQEQLTELIEMIQKTREVERFSPPQEYVQFYLVKDRNPDTDSDPDLEK